MKFKKIIATMLSLAMAGSAVTASAFADEVKGSASGSSPIIGDVDYDGSISSGDSLFVLRASVGLETLTAEQEKLCDVDSDGAITSGDALDILRYSVKLPVTGDVGKPLGGSDGDVALSNFKASRDVFILPFDDEVLFTVEVTGKPNGNIVLCQQFDDTGVEIAVMKDDGTNGDVTANDGIYSALSASIAIPSNTSENYVYYYAEYGDVKSDYARIGYRYASDSDIDTDSDINIDSDTDTDSDSDSDTEEYNLTGFKMSEASLYYDNTLYADTSEDSKIDYEEETGLGYPSNEVCIMVNDGVSEADVVDMLKPYKNAKIVGKNASLGDYQIRFEKDYSYDELTEIISEFEQDSKVFYVRLNYIINWSDDTMECVEDNINPSQIRKNEKLAVNSSESSLAVESSGIRQSWDYTILHSNKSYYYPIPEENPQNYRWRNEWSQTSGGENWGQERINCPGAWEYLDLMETVHVGVIDSGFFSKHPELARVCTSDSPSDATAGHGTHVAGIIGASYFNNDGINGVCPTARLDLVNLNAENFSFTVALSDLIERKSVKVINFSQGFSDELAYSATRAAEKIRNGRTVIPGEERALKCVKKVSKEFAIKLALLALKNNDFIICSSAGNANQLNYGPDLLSNYGYGYIKIGKNYDTANDEVEAKYCSPFNFIAYENPSLIIPEEWYNKIKNRIIVVGSSDIVDNIYPTSCINAEIVAPGVDIYSLGVPGDPEPNTDDVYYKKRKGTSMACPHVAGVAGMLYSLNPNLTGEEVKEILLNSSVEREDQDTWRKFKLLNAKNAVITVLSNEEYNKTCTYTYSGRVVDKLTGEPVQGAKVSAMKILTSGEELLLNMVSSPEIGPEYYIDYSAITDENGYFELKSFAGKGCLKIEKDGYLEKKTDEFDYAKNEYTSPIDLGTIELLQDYLSAYAKFLTENQTTFKNSTFMLGSVNDDDIPELIVCTDTSHVGTVRYYTYNGEVVLSVETGSYGLSKYIPRGNIMTGNNMNRGIVSGAYYKINDDGTGERLLSYSNNEDQGSSELKYTINGEAVSKEQYDEALQPYSNTGNYINANYSNGVKVNSTNIKKLTDSTADVVNPNDESLKTFYSN